MPDQSRRRRPPRHRRAPGEGPGPRGPRPGGPREQPSWMGYAERAGNAAAVELITGQSTDEATATELLRGTLDSGAEQAVSATPESTPAATPVQAEAPAQKEPTGKLAEVKAVHTARLKGGLALTMDAGLNYEMGQFKAHWKTHHARYTAVAAETGIPAELIAAIHWRECSGSFDKYLHQGDPLGKAATRVPTNIPIFHDWHKAAVHALTMSDKAAHRDNLGVTAETEDPATLATYAEAYNGLGYHNREKVSPYVYSGTDAYESGKYVRDGVFSNSAVDKQLGVITMMGAIGGMDISLEELTSSTAWKRVEAGTLVLKRGVAGKAAEMAVTALQEKLKAAGQSLGIDGDFGPGTEKALKAFQRAKGLTPSGAVDAATLAALN